MMGLCADKFSLNYSLKYFSDLMKWLSILLKEAIVAECFFKNVQNFVPILKL